AAVFLARNDKFCRNLDEQLLFSGSQITYREVRFLKVNFLAKMVAKFIEVVSEVILPDDRDMWKNKHVDTPGELIAHAIAVSLDTRVAAFDSTSNKRITSVNNETDKMLIDGFKTNNWGVKGM